jgi:outer membrane cobalamin receptor
VYLTLLAGGAPRLDAQGVRPGRQPNTAVSCQLLTAEQVSRHSTITSALQSRVNGLQLLHSSGQAGSGARLRIRGNSSIHQSAPLVFVDGVRVDNSPPGAAEASSTAALSLDLIDPRDVLVIEVFRGPSATALYGTNAAGGVINVYLKRGNVDPAWQAAAWPRCRS